MNFTSEAKELLGRVGTMSHLDAECSLIIMNWIKHRWPSDSRFQSSFALFTLIFVPFCKRSRLPFHLYINFLSIINRNVLFSLDFVAL